MLRSRTLCYSTYVSATGCHVLLRRRYVVATNHHQLLNWRYATFYQYLLAKVHLNQYTVQLTHIHSYATMKIRMRYSGIAKNKPSHKRFYSNTYAHISKCLSSGTWSSSTSPTTSGSSTLLRESLLGACYSQFPTRTLILAFPFL